jgi:hypothetical protein
MVRGHYPALGFAALPSPEAAVEFELNIQRYTARETKIRINERAERAL